MEIELVKIQAICGVKASFYSFREQGNDKTKFEEFLRIYNVDHGNEVMNILGRLRSMSSKESIEEGYLKMGEGRPGDGVCALYDRPRSILRLYAFKLSSQILILGSGGVKPKHIKALQQDPILTYENSLLRRISKTIDTYIKEGDIYYQNDGLEINGQLAFEI